LDGPTKRRTHINGPTFVGPEGSWRICRNLYGDCMNIGGSTLEQAGTWKGLGGFCMETIDC